MRGFHRRNRCLGNKPIHLGKQQPGIRSDAEPAADGIGRLGETLRGEERVGCGDGGHEQVGGMQDGG